MCGITYKVITFNEACCDAPLCTGALLANICRVGWPWAEFRTEKTGDPSCEKSFPPSVSQYARFAC